MVDMSKNFEHYIRLAEVFLPHTPIDQKSLFAGRIEQITAIADAVNQKGRHVILFGERGVGKTSLAKVFHDFLTPSALGDGNFIAPYVTCDTSVDYSSIWHRVFRQIEIAENRPRMGFVSAVDSSVTRLDSKLPDPCRPADIVDILQFLASTTPIVIVTIDEFDRIKSKGVTTLFADTIKALSDSAINVTLILVGVADNVNELIQEHASAERACVQIRMPRMSQEELEQIINNGLRGVDMTASQQAISYIVQLSQGLPHYTHLLGLHSARVALNEDKTEVTTDHVLKATRRALDGVQESIKSAYHQATISSKKTIYPQVLLACALAKVDERGTFAAVDIREPMGKIMKKPYDIPGYSKNLHDLCQPSRGPILQQIGVAKRYRFRFVNPLMQPFTIMHGLDSGLITEEDLIIQGTLDFEPEA